MKMKRIRNSFGHGGRSLLALTLGTFITAAQAEAATVFTKDFESYTGATASLEDTATANQEGPRILVAAAANPNLCC